MSDELAKNIDKAKEIYYMIDFLKRGIDKDKEINLKNHVKYIIDIIKMYNEMLDEKVFPNINLSDEITNYYNDGKQKLRELETKMEKYISEEELLKRHGIELHDNKEETQDIAPDTTDALTLDEIKDGQTIAYLMDESNQNTKFPPPPPFIYDKENNGIRKLIVTSIDKKPKNPFTRKEIEKVYLYTAKVVSAKESSTKNKSRKSMRTKSRKSMRTKRKTIKKMLKN